jgi:hypothetical protein
MPIIQRTMSNIYGLEDALDNIDGRINELEQTIFKQSTAPTVAEGADEGDVWYDTANETFNVYREYPVGSGVFIWEPLIYHNNDIINGGTW